jgi:hypothetical protein
MNGDNGYLLIKIFAKSGLAFYFAACIINYSCFVTLAFRTYCDVTPEGWNSVAGVDVHC